MTKEFIHEGSKQVILIIQNTSLLVNVLDLVFKYVFIALWNVSNQEVTKDDEQKYNNYNPEYPNN